uniref:DDHD domain containing 1a n=1 Tax=Astyanax mexicanus TaxID=7994 RepID=A0A8B9KZJ2_ASTMX
MSSFTSKTPFISPPQSPESRGSSLGSSSDWDYANDVFVCCYDESIGRGMQAVQAGVERHLPPLLRSRHRAVDGVTPGLDDQYTGYPSPSSANEDDGAASDHLLYSESDGNVSPLESRKRARSGAASSRHRLEVVTELGAEELRWFYKEDKKTWKPFAGHDSLKIELMYRKFCELNPVELDQDHNEDQHQDQEGASAALSEEGEHAAEVMDRVGTCGPGSAAGQVEEGASVETPESAGESDVDVSISVEAVCVRGGLYQVDVREKECYPVYWNPIHSLKLSRSHVDWHSVDEVYLYSDATTSKIARTVTQKLGFSKASSSGTRLHRGYVEEASLEDKPPQTTHIVFVVHGIGQKMDKDRIIKNTGMLREAVRKMEEKHFADHTEEHVEFLPVEWRSKLALDGDTVDSITPDKVRGLRDLLNSSAMDIMYYTSPLYRDEITKGLTQELNRLYALFCSRNPEFEEKGGKVSIISHSLGCVIAYDIMTGWDPVRFCLLEQQEPDEEEMRWMSYEERHLLEQVHLTRQRLRELEDKLQGLEASKPLQLPALKFKVENYFCMGSPLAVFLALRGIRPGSTGYQDHIMPKSICKRLFNIFHPTDPVAYRLEPLVLKHYSNIAPVQIHWCNTTSPTPYDEMKPTFLNPVKDPVSDTESLPSPSTSPVMNRRHYGESITNLGKASLLGAASIGKGIGGMLFSRFSRSSSQPSGVDSGVVETEEKSQSAYGLSTMSQSTSTIIDTAVEMEHRIDFELREGLVESRYWSAVTSHTAYWTSHDVALFLLTFIYKSQSSSQASEDSLDPE